MSVSKSNLLQCNFNLSNNLAFPKREAKVYSSSLFGFTLSVILSFIFSVTNGATLVVTNANNAGAGSLRQAILDANANTSADIINFSTTFFSSAKTINLLSALPAISSDINIIGPGSSLLTVSGNAIYRVFSISVLPAVGNTISISDITIANGNAIDGAGLKIVSAPTSQTSTITISRCIFTGNAATVKGACILNDADILNITNSVFSNNSGGAIFNTGFFSISNSTFSNNTGTNGGALNTFGGNFINCTFSSNSVTLQGGAIFNSGGQPALINCTLSGNAALVSGGAISSAIGVSGCLLSNTIVAGNTAPLGPDLFNDAFYPFLSQGYNFIGISNGSSGFTNAVNFDKVGSSATPLNPLLGALANNGGLSPTRALLTGSPCLNTGSLVSATDQRGTPRPQGGACDIGAFEYANCTAPTPVISGTKQICSGTTTNLSSSAGFTSYKWSTGATTQVITVSAAATYTVTVTNASNCTGTASAIVTVNSIPTPLITGTLSFCAGSTTSITTGTFPSYLWSTSATTKTIVRGIAGTYTVTVTSANGCTGKVSAVLTSIAKPAPVITGDLSFCVGTTTTLSAGSFTSYLWSTGKKTKTIVAGVSGTYTVTVTNAGGCSNTASAIITQKANPIINLTPSDAVLCPPSTGVLLSASGAATYSWSPALGLNKTIGTSVTANPGATSSYTVIGTKANGCTASASASVTVKPLPSNLATTKIKAKTAVANWSAISCASGYEVQYKIKGGVWSTLVINNANTTSKTFSGLKPSTKYQWRIQSKFSNGTTSGYTNSVYFTTLSLREGESTLINQLDVYPNPATDKLSFEFPFAEGDAAITIINTLGQTVLTQVVSNTNNTADLDINQLSEGLYLIVVKNGDSIYSSRFVKR